MDEPELVNIDFTTGNSPGKDIVITTNIPQGYGTPERMTKISYDYAFAERQELLVSKLMNGKKGGILNIEVKSERNQWAKTGNVFVEFWDDDKNEFSGIYSEEAKELDIIVITFVLTDNPGDVKRYNPGNDKTYSFFGADIDMFKRWVMWLRRRNMAVVKNGGDGRRKRGFVFKSKLLGNFHDDMRMHDVGLINIDG